MRTMLKGNQEEDEYEDDDFGSRKEGPSSNSNISNIKDARNNDKASATRSKHSVTEQRRRSKINERFQLLRDLVPHSDQKRDTASFLLEVIEYVQYLQEKVQKCEGSYQGWNSEPAKLIPWRNSHWRVPNFAGHSQEAKNGGGSTFTANLDENNIPSILACSQNAVEANPCRDEGPSKEIPRPRADPVLAHPLQLPVCDLQSIHCPTTSQHDKLEIEGGTISITTAYSRELLNTVAQALQNAGLDLSQASISVQIDLGKRANQILSAGASSSKDYENPCSHHGDTGGGDDSDQAQKRLKT